MQGLIWIIALFATAVGVAVAAHLYSGNVYIQVEQTLIRMNLHLFAVGLVLAVGLLYFFIKFLYGIIATPGKIGRFGSTRKYRKSVEALNQAGVAFFEGRYDKAGNEAAKVLANKHAGDNRVLALMIAAQAAQQSNNHTLMNRYLTQMADNLPEKAQLPRYLLGAENALASGNYQEAASQLKAAENIERHSNVLLRLQLRLAQEKGDAVDILEKTDRLQKNGAIGEEKANQYRDAAFTQLIAAADDSAALKAALKRIPNAQKAGTLCVPIAEQYEALGLYADAVSWIGSYYPHTHHRGLLPVFSRSVRYLSDIQQRKAIDTAESWLKTCSEDADLLLCLGELAYSKQLWGKAQNYFEASIAVKPSVQARLALAKVFDEVNTGALADEQRQLALGAITQAQ